jgi:hypothetical protein
VGLERGRRDVRDVSFIITAEFFFVKYMDIIIRNTKYEIKQEKNHSR